jgi:hypothetical protein
MPKEYDKPEIAPGNKSNLKTIIRAAKEGDLCLMAATEKDTGRRVDLLCAASYDRASGEVVMTPMAQMFMGNPYEMFDPPGSEGEEREETTCPDPRG